MQPLIDQAYATLRKAEKAYPGSPLLALLHRQLEEVFDAAAPHFPGIVKPDDGTPKT